MSPYRALYQVWCSKKRDRVLGAAADEEVEYRAAVVHTSFGRDPYVQGAEALLASETPQDAKLLSMYTGQVQMVARGDDLRGRKLKDLGTRSLSCVGKSRQHAPCGMHSIVLAAAAGRSYHSFDSNWWQAMPQPCVTGCLAEELSLVRKCLMHKSVLLVWPR
jgi:hypothetical protein